MNYKYVYLGFLKDGKQEIHKVEFGEFWTHPLGLSDITENIQSSIRDTVVEERTYKTITYITNISKDDAKKYYMMGDNLTSLGIAPNTVVGVSTKDGITLNNFNLTVGGNGDNTKPTCGPYKVKGNQLSSASPIWNSAYLDKNNTTFQTFVNCDLPAGSFHGWFCHQVTQGTGADFIFLYLVSSNFWEEGEVAPFGNTTPTGSIGGYGTYDDISDDFPIPDNIIDGVYASIFSNANGKIQIYTLDSSAYSAFLGKIYTNDFWQYWQNTIFNPLDGIYSCIRVPFNELALTRSAVAKINVSNTELEILSGAYRVTGGFVQDESIVSDYAIEEYFGSYLDYAPHTTCELYIPFYGTVNININEIMGGSISIVRRNNYINGDFVVFVKCKNRFGVSVTHAYSGNAAMTLPITAGNNGGPNRIIDLVQGVANVALGNYVGGAMNAVNAITEKGYASTVQKLSGGAGWCASHDFALIIHRLCQSNPEKYSEIKKRPADMFVKLSDLSGEYSIEKQNLDIHDKNITDEEITEIENILQGGAIF